MSYLCHSLDYEGDGFELLEIFQTEPYVFFLDSSLVHPASGRFSFVGFDPFEVVTGNSPQIFSQLRKKFYQYAQRQGTNPTPFSAGLMGYLSYDLGLQLENISLKKKRDLVFPLGLFGFYDTVIAIDHWAKKIFITSSGWPERNHFRRQKRAKVRLESILKRLSFMGRVRLASGGSPQAGGGGWGQEFRRGQNTPPLTFQSDFTKTGYFRAVRRALEHIRQGDIYQVNLAQRFQCEGPGNRRGQAFHPVEIYQALRRRSPSRFSGYFDCGDFQILSSSPEEFLRLQGRRLQTRPMKGTRPRGETPLQDNSEKNDLIRSAKDKAELLMITDLERNDLGRVCTFGSVKVIRMRQIESYCTVHQSTSMVEGRLRNDKDAMDVLTACFPGGSITGCPKIRAMQIIEELEPHHRGIYTGAMGYIGFQGDMNFNILIRTMLVYQKKIYFHAGGGIVADSTPAKEYHETLVKAKAMQDCLKDVLGGEDSGSHSPRIFLDGRWVVAAPALEESLAPWRLSGEGVFETMRVYGGKGFVLFHHLNRLTAGLKVLKIEISWSEKQLIHWIKELLMLNRVKEARLRLTIWRQNERVRISIVAKEFEPFSEEKYQKGFAAALAETRCRPDIKFANVKSIQYQSFLKAYEEARANGSDEALIFNTKGELAEGSRSNIFLVRTQQLFTPSLHSGCLNGITRQIVLQLARRIGIPAREKNLRAQDLAEAEEAFLTNSLLEIMPLTSVDGQKIGSGRRGAVTGQLMAAYKAQK